MQEKIKDAIANLIVLLVAKRYADVEALTASIRLTRKEIETTVSDYGRTLVTPPSEAWALLNIVKVKNSTLPKWSVVMPLWTAEEQRSDLSLECTAIQKENGLVVLELDDIHVL